MRFEWPLLLLVLLIVPAAVAVYLLVERRRARYTVAYSNLGVLASVAADVPRWRRFLPAALALGALMLALVALARPELSRSVPHEQASIALTVDVSGSMRAEDVKPTRLGAAQLAIERFLERVPERYRVGLVTFSAEAYVASPLAHDREPLLQALAYSYPGRGTAIGDALARTVEFLQPLAADTPATTSAPAAPAAPAAEDDDRPPTAIILLSDGAQTRGELDPLEGAERAASYGIPVYTIALGTPEGVIMSFGGFSRPVPPDPETLAQIAELTGGEAFTTETEGRLNEVYEHLASRLGRRTEWSEATGLLLGAAALLALAGGALSTLWGQRLP
jgi:Ca-activated chloride channel family protein